MRALLAVAVLAVLAEAANAQPVLVEPCGGVGSCVRIGTTDGGQVQLGGAVQTSRFAQPDGGANRVRIQPLSPIPGMEVLGNQSRTADQPDVIIGGFQARDGGQGPIVSVRTGLYEIAKFDTAGLTVNGTVTGGAQTVSSLAVTGNETVGGTLGVTGVSTHVAIDAGSVRVQGTLVPISSEQDGGTGQMRLLSGYCVLSSNDCAVTFNPAFGAIPDCTCSSVNATAAACGVKAIPSSSAVTFRGANASDAIYWSCHGAK